MTRLTRAQIADAARTAGFSGKSLSTAVAVALAESGGDANAHNAIPPDNSYGLWQINMIGSLGPSRRQQFGLTSNDQLYDPVTNAKAAFAISNGGTNFRPWTTYTSGAYLLHATPGTDTEQESPVTTVTPAGLIPDIQLPSGLTRVFEVIGSEGFWKRFGVVAIGVSLVIIGTVLAVSGTRAVKQATQLAVGAASKVVTKGVV